MEKNLRKLILFGIGVGVYTKETVEKELKSFIKENNLNVTEAKEVAKEFYKELDKYKKDAESKFQDYEKRLKDKLKKYKNKKGKKK